MQTFAAAAGTKLLTYDFAEAELRVIPILGWTHVQGNTAYPISALRNGGVTFGSAYEFDDESVYDPIIEAYYENRLEWEAMIRDAEPPYKVAAGETPADVMKEAKANLNAVTGAAEAEEDPDPLAHAVPRTGGDYDEVVFGTKTYKNNSFWVIEDRCVFIVPGEEPYPKEGAEKVKRVEFMAVKKELPEVDYWEVREDVDAVEEEIDIDLEGEGYDDDLDDVL